jgi:2-dehydro-3-deoxyglucarate aldolase
MPKQLLLNTPSIGSWITLGHPAIAEIMAEAGFDWLTVDLEHSTITIREAEDLIRIIELKGVVPLVRLTSNSSEQIKRVMDAGAHGVVVPMVCSADDARAAVAAVRYPPVGNRGVGLARAQGYGSSFETYKSWQESEATVVVQVEHIEAVNNLEEILTTDGVDAYIVGPYDLSGSMGIPGEFEDSKFVEAMNRIRAIAEQLKVPGGVHLIEPNPAELLRLVEQGNEFIAYSLDIRMIDISCRTGLAQVKKVCK